MRVKVYRNITRKCYSVMYHSRVIRHTNHLVLTNVKFNVRASGRERVRAEKRKNVHAFVEGEMSAGWPEYDDLVRVSYDPYKNDTFVLDDGTPFYSAKFVIFNQRGCWISKDDADLARSYQRFCEFEEMGWRMSGIESLTNTP